MVGPTHRGRNATVHPGDRLIGTGIGRQPPRPGRGALMGSILFHFGLVGAVFAVSIIKPDEPEFVTYRVSIVSPPPQVQGEPAPTPPPEEKIVARPEPEPEPPPPVEKPKPKPPEEKRVERTPVADTTPKPKDPEPVKGNAPDSTSAGGVGVNVDIPGQDFPFPEYLENIILQINRYFRWTGSSSPTAMVAFFINRDGSVGGLSIVERSADYRFNVEAMSAIEQAGKRGAFGPLPDGWVSDRLFVRYRFLPPGSRD